MTNSNKTKILDEISQIKKQLDLMFTTINKFDAILVLLSYRECMNNELSNIGRQTINNENFNDIQNSLAFSNVVQMNFIIEKTLNKFLHESKNSAQDLEISPIIESCFSYLPKTDPLIQEWALSRGNPEEDFWSADEIQLSGTYKIAYRHFIVKKYFALKGDEKIKPILNYLTLFARLLGLESVIKSGISAKLSDTSPFFSEYGISPEESLRMANIHPRNLVTNPPMFPSYKEDIHQIGIDATLSTNMTSDSPTQRVHHQKAHFSFFNEFLKIPGFTSEFETKTGVSLNDFAHVTHALKLISIKRDNAVGIESKYRLVIKIKKICNLNKKIIQKIINLLLVRKNDKIKEKCIVESNTDYIFGWTMVAMSCNKLVSKIYDDWVDSNSKGISFEEDCKQIFYKRNLICNKKRILIKKQIIPEEISEKLWKKVKKWAELDVIGIKKNTLFVIECKSESLKLKKSGQQMNRLGKYYEELWYKSKWISENLDEFKAILNTQNLSIPDDVKVVVPLLITLFIRPYNEKVFTFSPIELSEILDNSEFPIKNNPHPVKLNSNIVVNLESFQIQNK